MESGLSSQVIARSILVPVAILVFVFALAGRLDYWQGWTYNVVNLVILGLTYVALSSRKDLIKERLRPGPGMKRWDKIYYVLSTPTFLLAIIVACLDAGRFRWGPEVLPLVTILGTVVFVLGHIIVLWAKRVNRFFSSVVRIQTDREQTVCRDGPYRFVRHPGYVAGILAGLATPLVLGSFWALLPSSAGAALLIIRTHLEDETLKKELPGYLEYAEEVRFRLLPGIW